MKVIKIPPTITEARKAYIRAEALLHALIANRAPKVIRETAEESLRLKEIQYQEALRKEKLHCFN